MYSTCLYCAGSLGRNDVVESFPVGRRLAFDGARGRLWVVCRICERWNLSPLEERWEAVEDCEGRFRSARRRFSTANIGLARLPEGLELVRIGAPLRPEFAAWRYGDQFARRRRHVVTAGAAGVVATSALTLGAVGLGAVAVGGYLAARGAGHLLRRLRERDVVARVPTEDGDLLEVTRRQLADARLRPALEGADGWELLVAHAEGGQAIRGPCAVHGISLLMPAINGAVGTAAKVDRAIRRLEAFDEPVRFLRSAAAASSHHTRPGREGTLAHLPPDMRLAVEMAVNEENEQAVLEGELWLLDLAWREAEQIAAIADDLVTPPDVERRLRQWRTPNATPSEDR